MSALTDEKTIKTRNLGKTRGWPLAAVKCYAGGKCMINAAGFATPATAEASNKGVVGWFTATVDNSGGSAGDETVTIQEGELQAAAVSIAQTAVGAVVYSLDDQTFDETQLSNQPRTGLCTEYNSATLGWVMCSLATAS